jgi:histidinol dehydrogenase
MQRLSAQELGDAEKIRTRFFDRLTSDDVELAVRHIIDEVTHKGDAALLAFVEKFEGWRPKLVKDLIVGKEAMAKAWDGLDHTLKNALQEAASRIRHHHERQKMHSWTYDNDIGRLGELVRPLSRVGIYCPGGRAAYPSSVLMNAIPANVAGVGEIIMVSPSQNGSLNPAVLAAAHIAGVNCIFKMGGAHAIAALAYGTATVPKVDKITGPGNAYVAEAKRQVFGEVGIDMLAGPSEIVIIADASANPSWLAFDLMAQAEHDPLARSVLLSPEKALLDTVEKCLQESIGNEPRAAIIAESLANFGLLIDTSSLDEAFTIANRLAPEHLELAIADPESWLNQVEAAGAVFLGHYSAEIFGDYCAGTNHVLPTGFSARFSSPLGVYDFQKRISLLHLNQEGAKKLSPIAKRLAEEEGLFAHARAADARK